MRLVWGIIALIAIIVVGTSGYMFIEHWNFLDALFMTVMTITTVGYGIAHPLSDAGVYFTIFLIIGGVGGALYTLTGIITYIIEGQFGTTLGRRRMKARIAELKDHFIICGIGRVGEEIAHTFKEEGTSFVVIDNRPDCVARAEAGGFPFIHGDATSDDVLKQSGIMRARGLIAVVGEDADNVYIVLSARALHTDLFIEARASSEEAAKKLMAAGATRVVSPYSIGARRMAMLAIRPAVADFIDNVLSRRPGHELQLENVAIDKGSPAIGMKISQLKTNTSVVILAISKADDSLLTNLTGDEVIETGDRLIIIGSKDQLQSLEQICEVSIHE